MPHVPTMDDLKQQVARIDKLIADYSAVYQIAKGAHGRLDKFEQRLQELEAVLDRDTERITRLEGFVDGQDVRLEALEDNAHCPDIEKKAATETPFDWWPEKETWGPCPECGAKWEPIPPIGNVPGTEHLKRQHKPNCMFLAAKAGL